MAISYRMCDVVQIVNTDLGQTGAAYVNARLASGGALSKSLLSALGNLDNAMAPLPDGVTIRDGNDLDIGGVAQFSRTLQALIAFSEKIFPSKSDFCFLVEDSWAKPSDVLMLQASDKILLKDNTVIHAMAGEEFDENGVRNILRSVQSFAYTGFMIGIKMPYSSSGIRKLDPDVFDEILRHVRVVVVSAFDRVGTIISTTAQRPGGP